MNEFNENKWRDETSFRPDLKRVLLAGIVIAVFVSIVTYLMTRTKFIEKETTSGVNQKTLTIIRFTLIL